MKKNFCKDVCVSSAYVSSIKKSISDEVKARIAEVYPELNMDWLVTGRQPMIRPEYDDGGEYEYYTRFTEAVSGHFRENTDMEGKTECPEDWKALVQERDMEKKVREAWNMVNELQPEAQEILDRYKGGRLLLSCAEGYQHLDQFCRRWREGLRSMGTGSYQGKRGTRPAAFPELTPYWCRHSWATQAHRCGVPLDIIARALGHSWSVVTDIYVLYDDAKADEANRLVIDSLK